MPAVTYTVSIDGVPTSQELLQSIQQIEVEDYANMADMLRLQVVIAVKDGAAGWSFIDDDLFSHLANIKIAVAVGSGRAETLLPTCPLYASMCSKVEQPPTFRR